MGIPLTEAMVNILTELVGKVLDIYNHPQVLIPSSYHGSRDASLDEDYYLLLRVSVLNITI